MNFSLEFPRALGEPTQTAQLKSRPEDFIVDEIFSFDPAGVGEHLYLHVKKTGENTLYVADALAGYFGIKKMDVGVAGMKDRNAVTSQWFSCYLPGSEERLDATAFIAQSGLGIELLEQVRHNQKLRRGDHQGNAFCICLRNLSENAESETRLQNIKTQGVPNYFGAQRFGRDAGNLKKFDELVKADALIKPKNKKKRTKQGGRNQHGVVLSAARSWLFNLVLAERVKQNSWRELLPGEADIDGVATGPLWGRGRSPAKDQVLAMEDQTLAAMRNWCLALEHSGLKQERRPLQLQPQNFSWEWQQNSLLLNFQLNPGEYATSVLREICFLKEQEKVRA